MGSFGPPDRLLIPSIPTAGWIHPCTHGPCVPTTPPDEPFVEECDMFKFCIGATIATMVFIATFAMVTTLVSAHSMVSAGY